jgi:DNA-binding NarL/FixJ family response regulator
MAGPDALEEGRASFRRGAWSDAYAALSASDQAGLLEPGDLERLAVAAYLTGRDEESSDLFTRAHHALLDLGESERAAQCAYWLAFGLIQRGEMAQGGGWLARAQRVLDSGGRDSAVRGYLLVPVALQQLGGGDHEAALATFREVDQNGERFGDRDLQTLGRLGQGQALLHRGDAARGRLLFDVAMVAVTASVVSAVVSGIVYCAVIDECEQSFDVRRAREWTAALSRWCDAQPGLVPYRGQCLVHRSQVMMLLGDWPEAMEEARTARARLSDPPHPAIGMALYQLGELHRLRGEFADAEDAYRRANEAGRQPQPGLALLRLAQGRAAAAAAAIEGALEDSRDHVSRARMLPACVEIMLTADRMVEARQVCDQLVEIARASDAELLDAQAEHARGAVLLSEGNAREALEALRSACTLWRTMATPYHFARTQVLIARACRAVGDDDTAELEAAAARTVLVELGAKPDVARLNDEASGRDGAASAGLSPRELEVLLLVAGGRTNRQIAEALVISDKTVARHVSNIFTKIDCSSRSAATAYAYENGLV